MISAKTKRGDQYMGGSGSGRWFRHSTKRIVENSNTIDIRRLHRDGLLEPGNSLSMEWSFRGKPDGEITINVEHHRMRLVYYTKREDKEWEAVDQPVNITWTPCHYGGSRPWFFCPECDRRAAVIYGAGKYFLCRHCHTLVYQSQNSNKADRLMATARKIRRRLGADERIREPIVFKPKNMHQKTFDSLRHKVRRMEGQFWSIIAESFGDIS